MKSGPTLPVKRPRLYLVRGGRQDDAAGLPSTVVSQTPGETKGILTKPSIGHKERLRSPRKKDMPKKKHRILNYAKFIDPKDAGSFVGYHGPEKYEAGVTLTFSDCTKIVTWNIRTKGGSGIKKVKATIAVLEKLVEELEKGTVADSEYD
jgi:hypothetical protein